MPDNHDYEALFHASVILTIFRHFSSAGVGFGGTIHVGRIGRPDPISLAEARFRRLSELSIRPAFDRCVAGIVSFIHAMADRLIRCTALDVCTFTQLVIRGQARSVHFSPMSLADCH